MLDPEVRKFWEAVKYYLTPEGLRLVGLLYPSIGEEVKTLAGAREEDMDGFRPDPKNPNFRDRRFDKNINLNKPEIKI